MEWRPHGSEVRSRGIHLLTDTVHADLSRRQICLIRDILAIRGARQKARTVSPNASDGARTPRPAIVSAKFGEFFATADATVNLPVAGEVGGCWDADR